MPAAASSAAEPQQQQQVEGARRVGEHALQAPRAGPALPDQLLDADTADPGQRHLDAGEQAGAQDEQGGDQQRSDISTGHEPAARASRQDDSSSACRPNISACSAGSPWS